MRSADTDSVARAAPESSGFTRPLRRRALSAVCLLPLLIACARTPPQTAPRSPSPGDASPASTPPATARPPRGASAEAAPARPLTSLSALRDAILEATAAPGVQRATWGIVVHSLDRNERLFELNAHALLVPASIGKLLSVATASEAVGWDYRFTTTLGVSGSVSDGVLQGDLIAEGNGDPAIGGRGGDDMSVFVDAVRAAGITSIDGRVIGSDDLLEEPRPAFAWAWDDLGYPTGALFGALNYGENRTVVTVAPASAPGRPGVMTLDATAEGRPLINRTVTAAGGATQLLWPEQRPGEAALTIAGTIAAGAAPARVNIAAGNPTFWFATVLRNRLIAAGIPVLGAAVDRDDLDHPVEAATIFTYRSRTLAEIAQPMLKESINLYAEAAMRLNAPAASSPRTNDDALAGFTARLDAWGLGSDTFQVVDGSGLSRRDAVAPEAFLAVLQRMYDASGSSPWMRALPVAGVDGSLRLRMKGTAAENNLRAKTGSMSNIRSLAGYVTTADGERLAIVIMLNDFEGPAAAALQAIDTIAVRLATFRR